jgi:drug/metabolite transporter (DMT)-like permease
MWGAWGALIEVPEKHFSPGFPSTLGYIVWSITMVPCAIIALQRVHWHLEHDRRAIFLGSLNGLLGAAGQLILFQALRNGPAYLVFPVVSLAPVITIVLAYLLLRERTNRIAGGGVLLALVAIVLLSLQTRAPAGTGGPKGHWLPGTLAALIMWGVQAYEGKFALRTIRPESLFFYMAAAAVILSPIAWWLTDFRVPINWRLSGPALTALIQFPNALGALLSTYATRAGKATIVSPTINGLYPVIAIVLSLLLYARWPEGWNVVGMALAITGIILMSYGEAVREEQEELAHGASLATVKSVSDEGF